MSEGDALWQAILAEPRDDLPRLAYADWLEESGKDGWSAWAEFIRAGLELWRAGWRGVPHFNGRGVGLTAPLAAAESHRRLFFRAEALFHEHGMRWAEGMAAGTGLAARRGVLSCHRHGLAWGQHALSWSWPRGFPDHLRLSAKAWNEMADNLLKGLPVTAVTLSMKALPPLEHAGGRFHWLGRPDCVHGEGDLVEDVLGRRWPGIDFGVSE